MAVKLSELGKKLGLEPDQLIEKLTALGVTLKANARSIDDESAQLLEQDMAVEAPLATEPLPTLKAYEVTVEKELDKEIIKSQRKMTAGKDAHKSKKPTNAPSRVQSPVVPGVVEISESITVKEFCEKTGLSPIKVIGMLMKNGILANINQSIDYDTASIIADDFHIPLRRKRADADIEDLLAGNLATLLTEKDDKDLSTRAPIVTVMGHVDHGKTSLLDAIRETSVASKEAGGITQHIGAYQVEKNGRKITFIDTPGHEAFTTMRARGAKITDIVILVVAADEGIKPQTTEALNHAQEAGVPIIVAINKIDKEGANVDRVKAQLAELGLQPEEWGGNTIMVPLSAVTGEGIPTLLEMIILSADLANLRANPNRPAVATILEARLDKNMGPVATMVVNTGTLSVGDNILVGSICGRVKTMKNHLGKLIQEAAPATPVVISGLEESPSSGEVLQVVKSMDEARAKSEQIRLMRQERTIAAANGAFENIITAIAEGKLKTLKIVLKTDALGTLEALKMSLAQVKKEDMIIKIIHGAVGAISESDVMMASASKALVVGFNALANAHVTQIAHESNVQILTYNVIYKLIDDLKKILSGMLEPQIKDVILGRAEVRAIFLNQRKSMIVGCKVISGKVENKARVRIYRKEEMIGEGVIGSLKKINDQVHEVSEGAECGIKFEGETVLEEGDQLEAWKTERVNPVSAAV